MVAPPPAELVAGGLGVCKDGISLLAVNGSGAAGTSAGFVLSDVEMERAAEDLKHALVLKFLSSKPSIDVLRGHTVVVCRVGEKPVRKEGLRKEREKKVWKEVGRKDSLKKSDELTIVVAQDQGDIGITREKKAKTCGCSGSENINEISETGNTGRDVVIMEEVRDVEEEVEGVVCRNSFAVLSDGDNELRFDPQKEYSSNPGAILDKIIVWNVRGMGTSKRRMKKLMKDHNVSVLAVSEPFQDVGLIRKWASCLQFQNFSSNIEEGGKILVFWKDNIQLEVVGTSNQCLTVLLSAGSSSLLATFVYVKCSPIERRAFWEKLYDISDFNVPWVVLGDFKTIRSDMERVGGRPRNSSFVAEFNKCISRCVLLDLRFEGRQLSWCNGHQGLARSWAKLDKVLINNEFVVKYGDAKALLLYRNSSDHSPILLQFFAELERYGPASFRFQNMWTSHTGFLDVVGNSCNEPMVSESGLHRLVGKLKRIKQRLRVWNKEIFGRVDGFIRELEERVEHHEEMLQAEYSATVEEEFLVSKAELDVWNKRDEMRLAQQVKIKWLSKDDQNSKFFHAVIAQRRRNSCVKTMVLLDVTSLDNMEMVHNGADEDVYEILKSISVDSSPGLDGFGSSFYLTCWKIIKSDVMEAVKEFFKGDDLPHFYCSSIIVDKLSLVIGELISSEQEAFVRGKSIFENVTLTEKMTKMLYRKSSGPLFAEFLEGEHSQIRLKDLVIDNVWDVEELQRLSGLEKADEVRGWVGKFRNSKNVLLWLPEKNGCFNTKSA
ncbi:hypothetical protein LWI28_013379 [Acer negundo]|uniref:Uncharacterized protein n=1 Tax=Acer negundo TaxID=4023 RepID=A0AAD5J5R1_ACENE|nr:hypothetical protein LWI28_013379 [Acer negundo]